MERIVALVEDLDDDAAGVMAPATPDWRVRDLVAHVVGITGDVIAGNLEGAGSDPWTAAQVLARHDRPLGELLAEWESNWEPFSTAMDALDPFRAAQSVFDVTTHEHDIRGALDQAGARDSDGLLVGWAWATGVVGQLRDGYGAGALLIETEHGDTTAGTGDVTGSVRAERFDLWRAMTGRRSVEQVEAFAWEGEPASQHLCLLPARATPLVE